jgi:hypothetical protein
MKPRPTDDRFVTGSDSSSTKRRAFAEASTMMLSTAYPVLTRR